MKRLFIVIAYITATVAFAQEHVSEIAKKRKLPVNSPKYDDVSVTSRWPDKRALKIAKEYDATRLDWCYIYMDLRGRKIDPTKYIKSFHDAGIKFSAAISQHPQDKNGKRGKPGRLEHRVRTIHGKLAPAKETGFQAGWGAYSICLNNPKGKELMIYWHNKSIDFGADSFQHDDTLLMSDDVPAYCYCKFCMDKFPKFLKRKYSSKKLKQLGIEDIDTFNYKGYLLGGKKSVKLASLFVDFMFETDLNFFKELRAAVDKHAGRHVPFSKNNGSHQRWTKKLQLYDYSIGELSDFTSDIVNLNQAAIKSIDLDKMQIINCPKGKYENEDRKTAYRRTISFGYALGIPVMAPWDMWEFDKNRQKAAQKEGKIYHGHRMYPPSSYYADLFKFVQKNKDLFREYERVSVAGFATEQNAFLANDEIKTAAPVLVNADDIFAFVRAIPGNSSAPAVIHLVDGRAKRKPFTITINPRRFSNTNAVKVELLRPGMDTEIIASGIVSTLKIPELKPWGILKLSSIKLKATELAPPIIENPASNRVGVGDSIILKNLNKNGKIHFTLNGNKPDAKSPVYTVPISLNKSMTIRAKVFENNKTSKETSAKFRFCEKIILSPIDAKVVKADIWLDQCKIIDRKAIRWDGKEGKNKSLEGGKISIDNKKYDRGLSVRAHSELVFEIKPEYQEFVAMVGLDDAAGSEGSISFIVKVDGQKIFKSPPSLSNAKKKKYIDSLGEQWSGKNTKAMFIHLKIPEGSKTLTLVVDGYGDGVKDDLGCWADAGFISKGLKHHFEFEGNNTKFIIDSASDLISERVHKISKLTVNGVNKKAFKFDGLRTVAFKNASSFNIGKGDFSITTWIKRDDISATPHDNERIISKLKDKNNKYSSSYELIIGKSKTGFRLNFGTKSINKYVNNPQTGKWQFIALVINRKKDAVLYLNGMEVAKSEISQFKYLNMRSQTSLYIGGRAHITRFKGLVDDIKLYNIALSPEEISQEYKKYNK